MRVGTIVRVGETYITIHDAFRNGISVMRVGMIVRVGETYISIHDVTTIPGHRISTSQTSKEGWRRPRTYWLTLKLQRRRDKVLS